jgi:hypothetical protein
MMRLIAADARLIALIPVLRMARQRSEPATIDRTHYRVVVPASYNPYPFIDQGMPFGPFHELILRVERFFGPHERPAWFQPKGNVNHIALHSAYGHAVYFEVRVDERARAAAHPFDLAVSSRVDRIPQPMGLFDEPEPMSYISRPPEVL